MRVVPMSASGLYLSLLLLIAMFGGCFAGGCAEMATWWIGEGSFQYDCQGRLLQSDGITPLPTVRMRVMPARVELVSTGSDIERSLKTDVVRTDAGGAYRGMVNSRYAGPGNDQPKTFDSLFVYVEQPNGWHVYEAKLTKAMQPRTESGRKINMPNIAVGRDPTLAVIPVKANQGPEKVAGQKR